MDFRYSPDELEVLRYARECFRARLPLSRLRDAGDSVQAWSAIGSEGWLHACLPEKDSQTDLAVLAGLAREAGAVSAGEEFVQNGWLIPRLCAAIEDPSISGLWLDHHRTQPGYVHDPQSELAHGAHPDFDRYVVDRREDGQWERVRRCRCETVIDPLAGLSTGVGRVTTVGGDTIEAALRADSEYLRLTQAGVRVLRAAALVGVAAEILDRTVTYVGERHQFGRPIGQFQAVKHMCADLHTELQVAWLAVQYSAVCWHTDSLALDQATNQAVQAAMTAARTGAQLHGGMGFTWESDLHWLLKSALDAQLSMGPPGTAASAIGAALLDTA